MKRTLTGIAAASMVLGMMAPAALASTSSPNYNQRTITVGSYTANVSGIAAKDGNHATEFMPIWYLKQGLQSLGYKVSWDGTTRSFNITASGSPQVTAVQPIPGDTHIYVNGTCVANAPKPLNAKDPASGKLTAYLPIYYFNSVLSELGYSSKYDGSAGTWTVQALANQLTITGAPSGSVAENTDVALGLTSNGSAVTSGVTWSVSGTGATVDAKGNFVATAAGTYTVTATYAGKTATASITVYGQPAGVTLTPASSTVVANSNATDKVTVKVVDANGNVVQNFNGWVELYTNSESAWVNGSDYVQIVNGVGTATVSASDTGSYTVSSYGLYNPTYYSEGENVNLGSTTITAVAPQAAGLSLTAASKTVSNNTPTTDALTVGFVDQAGNDYSSQGSTYVTFTLTGPATFADNGKTTLSEYVTDGTPLDITSLKGESGPITVTATANGLTSASTTVNSITNTTSSSIKVTSSTSTVTNEGYVPYTIYTVTLLDKNGNPVVASQDHPLTITDNSSSTGATLDYATISDGTASSFDPTSGVVLSNGTSSVQFAVANEGEGSGPVTLTITDPVSGSTQTVTYTPQAGPAYEDYFLPDTITKAQAGGTVNYTLQVEDYYGNSVAQAGDPITLYVDEESIPGFKVNGVLDPSDESPLHLTTNAQGQVPITVSVPSNATSSDYFELYAVDDQLDNSLTPTVDDAYSNYVYATDASQWATAIDLTGNYFSGVAVSSQNWTGSLTLTDNQTLANKLGDTTVYALPVNAVGEFPSSADDEVQVKTSNANVVSVNGGTSSTGYADSGLPDITAVGPGTATLTFTDVSQPNGPTLTETITVVKGSPVQIEAVNPDGTMYTAYTFPTTAGNVGPFTLQIQDAAGNEVALNNGPVTLTADQVDALIGVPTGTAVRTSTTGADVSGSGTVTIAAGQSSLQVWVDNGNGTLDGQSTTATSYSPLSTYNSVY